MMMRMMVATQLTRVDAAAQQEDAAPVEPATLVLVEDHPLFLDALQARLSRLGYVVAAALTHPLELLPAYQKFAPDLVLVDLSLPGTDGAELARQLLTSHPEAKVVVLSAYDDAASIARCLDAGACGFISKRVDASELAECLHTALRGEPAFDRRSARTVIASLRSPSDAPTLSAREIEILQLVANGRTTAEIGRQLHLSPFTVKTHIAKILNRLDVADRAAAVAVALRAELIT
jgi:DNA-binding NarL/FixJ family response regulator